MPWYFHKKKNGKKKQNWRIKNRKGKRAAELRESMNMTLKDMLNAKKTPQQEPIIIINDDDNKDNTFKVAKLTREEIADKHWPPVSSSITDKSIKILTANTYTDPMNICIRPSNTVMREAIKRLAGSQQNNAAEIVGLGVFNRDGLAVIQNYSYASEIKKTSH